MTEQELLDVSALEHIKYIIQHCREIIDDEFEHEISDILRSAYSMQTRLHEKIDEHLEEE